MKPFWRRILAAAVLSLSGVGGQGGAARAADLAAGFAQPPDTAKAFAWWHWMNGNISHDGITKDLEAIKAAGLGGVVLFEESDRIPVGPVRYFSDQHLALIAHASRECERLGLKFAFHNCPGWSSAGGPWITPDQAMKHLTWSEQTAAGGRTLQLTLPRPPTAVRPFKNLGPPARYEPDHGYYRDVAVLAFPTPVRSDWRLEQWEEKADFLPVPGLKSQTGAAPSGAAIDPAAIVNLTDRLKPDGSLNWDAPVGNWTILRFGYTLTEHTNREPPMNGGRGLECDKLSAEAVDAHWRAFDERILAVAGSKVYGVTMDSYEPLSQTWTPRMPDEFRRRREYDLVNYLPCLTGRVVGTLDRSERFLWDFRRTIADLMADNYYGRFEEKCRERGLALAIESYGYYGTFFDDFENSKRVDIPMGEFWAGVVKWHHWSNKVAASAADLTGRHLVGAEAFTAGNGEAAWKWHPGTLKAQGDYFLCRGMNRVYFQASAHQPWADNIRPGMTMGGNGIQMNRNNTWFSQSRGWLAHLARSQYLLQQGTLVTDIFFDYGDNAPGTLRPNASITDKGPKGVPWSIDLDLSPDIWAPLPTGRDFHVGNDQIVLQMHVNARGQVELPGGLHYDVLILPHDDRMLPTVLAKVAELVAGGAAVMAPRPVHSPSLSGGMEGDAAFTRLAGQVWGDLDGRTVTRHAWGKGAVYCGVSVEQVLEERGVPRDFEYRSEPGGARFDYIHRQIAGAGDFYFVSNQRNEPGRTEATFRATGRPRLWWPETGEIAPAPLWRQLADGRTAVTLDLGPAEACFVVFGGRDDAGDAAPALAAFLHDGRPIDSGEDRTLDWRQGQWHLRAFAPGSYTAEASGRPLKTTVGPLPAQLELSDRWEVVFPAGYGAPARTSLPHLISLSKSADEGVKYFSGTAVYSRSFDVPSAAIGPGRVARLDLGDVAVIAEVAVNGRGCGLLWKQPYSCDVTSALRPGPNQVTVKVTTLWRNRLAGDAKLSHAAAADLADPMLAGRTKLSPEAVMAGAPDFPAVPDWVKSGGVNPDPRITTYTTFPFIQAGTPLVPSGLIGPARLVFGSEVPLQ